MTTTKKPWKAPTLTHYGKLSELTQAGSLLFSKDITGDGVPELFYDFAVDGSYGPVRTVEISGGGGTLTVSGSSSTVSTTTTFNYDTNSDGQTDLVITQQAIGGGGPNPPMAGAVLDVTVPNNTTAQNLWDLRDGVDNIP